MTLRLALSITILLVIVWLMYARWARAMLAKRYRWDRPAPLDLSESAERPAPLRLDDDGSAPADGS